MGTACKADLVRLGAEIVYPQERPHWIDAMLKGLGGLTSTGGSGVNTEDGCLPIPTPGGLRVPRLGARSTSGSAPMPAAHRIGRPRQFPDVVETILCCGERPVDGEIVDVGMASREDDLRRGTG